MIAAGTHALRCYRLLLDGRLAAEVERVVVFGHPTLSRPVQRLLARDEVESGAGTSRGVWSSGPSRSTMTSSDLDVEESLEKEWLTVGARPTPR